MIDYSKYSIEQICTIIKDASNEYQKRIERMKIEQETVKKLQVQVLNNQFASGLINYVEDKTGIPVRSDSRMRELVMCRFVLIKYLYDKGVYSLKQIGLFFGIDHSTVLYAVRQHDILFEQQFDRFMIAKEKLQTLITEYEQIGN